MSVEDLPELPDGRRDSKRAAVRPDERLREREALGSHWRIDRYPVCADWPIGPLPKWAIERLLAGPILPPDGEVADDAA